jgi:hypothetical protein
MRLERHSRARRLHQRSSHLLRAIKICHRDHRMRARRLLQRRTTPCRGYARLAARQPGLIFVEMTVWLA